MWKRRATRLKFASETQAYQRLLDSSPAIPYSFNFRKLEKRSRTRRAIKKPIRTSLAFKELYREEFESAPPRFDQREIGKFVLKVFGTKIKNRYHSWPVVLINSLKPAVSFTYTGAVFLTDTLAHKLFGNIVLSQANNWSGRFKSCEDYLVMPHLDQPPVVYVNNWHDYSKIESVRADELNKFINQSSYWKLFNEKWSKK